MSTASLEQVRGDSAGGERHESGPLALDDASTIVQLRAVLESRGYNEEGIRQVLGEEDDFEIMSPADVQKYLRRLPGNDRRSTLIKLFLLGRAVELEEAAWSLAPLDLERLEDIGILERAGEGVQAAVRFVCNGGLTLVCDGYSESRQIRFDHVAAAFHSTMSLGCLTIRRPVQSALDVGTGSGILALVASMHSGQVTATDINPRALNFTAFNAILNGASNVECLEGSYLEPVKGRKFDLIISNPPFIISPEYAYEFRDSQLPGDRVCRDVIRQIPEYLEEGGFGHVIFNWIHRRDEDWTTPLREWVEGNGCDALFLRISTEDSRKYAARYHEHLQEEDPAAYSRALKRWFDYYEEYGVEAISYGVVILRRRSGEANWFRAESLPGGEIHPSGDHILRVFETQDYLSGVKDDQEMLNDAFALVEDVKVEPSFVNRDGEFVVQGVRLNMTGGLRFQGAIDQYTYLVLHHCDGRRQLGEIISQVTQIRALDEKNLTKAVLPVIRRLTELGFLSREEARNQAWRKSN